MDRFPYRTLALIALSAAGMAADPQGCSGDVEIGAGGSGGGVTSSSSSGIIYLSSSSSSSSSSTSGGPVEDCANGVDDDNDGSVDCEDPDCQDYMCSPPAPPGWLGPFVYYEGSAQGFPACPPGYPGGNQGIDELVGGTGIPSPPPQAMCTCSCDPPANPTCKIPSQLTVLDATCANQANCGALLNISGNCMGASFSQGGQNTCGANAGALCNAGTGPCNVSVSTPQPTVTGTCIPQHTTVIPQVDFLNAVHLCGGAAPSNGGCGGGKTCVPKAPLPFDDKLCVAVNGDTTCTTAAPYLVKQEGFATAIDTSQLQCSACNCGALTGASCTANLEIYSDTVQGVCSTLVASFPLGTCHDVPGNPTLGNTKIVNPVITNAGACAPSGGVPQGLPQLTGKYTICCLP